MRKTISNTISEAIFAQTRLEVRETLETLRAAIWRKYDMREQVLEDETGHNLYMSMMGERFLQAYGKRHDLRTRNEEDLQILILIQRELDKL